jgi:hypothetical protein
MARIPFGAVLGSFLSTLALTACDGPAATGRQTAASTAATFCSCSHLTAIDGEAVAVYLPRGCVVPTAPGGGPATVPWCNLPSLPQPPHAP